MRLDDAVAFGVERHGADVRPVARVARPSCRVERASLEVQRVTSRQDGAIVAGMALRRADAADAAVSMLDVVPINEADGPCARRVQVGESLGRGTRAGTWRYGTSSRRRRCRRSREAASRTASHPAS